MKITELSKLGHRAAGFLGYRQISDIDFPETDPGDYPYVEEGTMEKGLLDMIFSVNPITLLPEGDIALHLHKDTPPDVRRFIDSNLHQPYQVDADSSGQFSSLDDDTIAELSRGISESLNDYRARIVGYVREHYQYEQIPDE